MRNLRDYSVITGTYWVFTLTDGALRMLVLLYLHQLGRTPFEIASLFLFYEFFGVVTNLLGGWIGARYGLKSTLFSGVALQIFACSMLGANASDLTLPIVMLAQALSGTAKDLTKMSSKSYVKLVVPEGDQFGLMRLVAILTGSKNTLKGVGFFLGGWLLAGVGFRGACFAMVAVLALALVVSVAMLPAAAGRTTRRVKLKEIVSRDARVNWLSAARFFLFGSRDVWFVLALPLFLSSALGWSHSEVGAFLALWVIGYGVVQALAPALVAGKGAKRRAPTASFLAFSTGMLLVPLGCVALALHLGAPPAATLVAGLAFFAVVFAVNSAVHSYLIVAYADSEDVSLKVGFYYMANAAGRLVGTVLSGVLFQLAGQGQDGLQACLIGSMLFVGISSALCLPLKNVEARQAQ